MLTLRDCLDMCDLSPEIVEAIADHEHLPGILAIELCNCLACSNSGLAVIHRVIKDGIDDAARHGDHGRLARMENALGSFQHDHPGLTALA